MSGTIEADPLAAVRDAVGDSAIISDDDQRQLYGQDVFTVPWSCPSPPVETPGGIAGSYLSTTDEPVPAHGDGPYRPWSTLWPRAWAPVVEHDDDEWRAGATTGGVDALGYHVWNATATWSLARAADLAI